MEEILNNDASNKTPKRSRLSWVVIGACGSIFVGVYALTIPFVAPALRRICLPYVPATTEQVGNIMKALLGRKGSVLDIGSGDGRIVIEAAKRGFQSVGVELNMWLVIYSKYKAMKNGVSPTAKFYRKDLWKTSLNRYDNIVIFGVEQMMQPLEDKFNSELTPDTNVIVCRFPLPNWQPVRTIGLGIDTVWVYKKPRRQ